MRHHILVKWNEQVTDHAALCAQVRELFQGVLAVSGVDAVSVHPNVIDRANRYDLLILITMDKDALPVYDDCPTHHAWKDRYSRLIAQKVIFDCE